MENIKIQNYVKKLLDIQEKNKTKPLNLNELKEIALSSGIQEYQWQEMIAQANKNTEIAKKHYDHKNYQNAYDRATQAINVNPYLINALIIASEAAIKIYQTENKIELLSKAEKHAKEILKHSQTEPKAFSILAEIEQLKQNSEKNKKNKKIYIIGAAIAIIIITLTIIGISKKTAKPSSRKKNELIEKREYAIAQWAQVENVMNRRDNLLPQIITLTNENKNILELNEQINKLKTELKNATIEEKINLQLQIQTNIRKLTALIKNNGNNSEIELLMIQIEGTYNRISVETKKYNEAAKQYNILLKKNIDDFPDFKELQYFQ